MKYIKKYNEDIDWDWVDEEKPNIPDDFKGNENFYNFLVDNNILDQFIYNFNNYKFDNYRDLKEYFKNFKKSNDYLSWAFKWSRTHQGHNFWSNLNDKWIEKI